MDEDVKAEKLFHLDGRDFHGITQSLSAEREYYLLAHLRRSGASEIISDKTKSIEQRAQEVLTALMLSGASFHVLAGCLSEPTKRWAFAEAESNAKKFAAITDVNEKLAMRSVLTRIVADFFAFGLEPPTASSSDQKGAVDGAGPHSPEKLQTATEAA